jgi:DNA polymerase-3 subunit epsilon
MPEAPLADVVIFDTETTGTGPDARLVELGALHVRDGKLVEQFQTLVDPEVPIPAHVTRIHGIGDAMVKGAPRVKSVLRAFVAFVGNRPLMAHNASFDRRIVGQELTRVGLRSPGIPLFCSLRLARRVFPEAPGHNLSSLARYLQIPDPPVHRALADCMTTFGLLLACTKLHPLRSLHVLHGAVTVL